MMQLLLELHRRWLTRVRETLKWGTAKDRNLRLNPQDFEVLNTGIKKILLASKL
jgi:hypothetical protein